MGKPAVSVIIPVWNCERYLQEAIESVLSQSLRDFELIVVNDGSSDRSEEIASGFLRDPRVRIINQPNSGVVAARNAGLRAAKAEFVAFLDADDMAMPDRLSKQFAYMHEHPEVAVLGSHITHFTDAKKILHTEEFPVGPARVTRGLESRNTIAQPSVMLRKQMAIAAGGYRDAFRFGAEDYDLWLRLAENHLLDNLPEALTFYRIHTDSLTHKRRYEQGFGALAAACAHRRRLAGLPDPLEGLKTPLVPDDLYRFDLTEEEEARFMPALVGLLSRKESASDSYVNLTRRAWELRSYISRGRLVRHCLAPAIAALYISGRNAEATKWLARAFLTEPMSTSWMFMLQLRKMVWSQLS